MARVAAHALPLGDVELLVNNAGYGTNGDFLALDGAREVAMVKLNALAPLALAQRSCRRWSRAGRGGVINVSSIGAFQPVPYMATYGATKAFLLAGRKPSPHELRNDRRARHLRLPGPDRDRILRGRRGRPGDGRLPHVMSAEALVARTLDAFDDGRAVLVPGAINWLTAFVTRLSRASPSAWSPAAVRPARAKVAQTLNPSSRVPTASNEVDA